MRQPREGGRRAMRQGLRVSASPTLCSYVSIRRCAVMITVCANLVGDTMIAPTWCFFIGSPKRSNRSIVGMRKASVLPLPVTAWFARSDAYCIRIHRTHLDHHILVPHEQRDSARLDWRHALEAHARDGIKDPFRKARRERFPSSCRRLVHRCRCRCRTRLHLSHGARCCVAATESVAMEMINCPVSRKSSCIHCKQACEESVRFLKSANAETYITNGRQ